MNAQHSCNDQHRVLRALPSPRLRPCCPRPRSCPRLRVVRTWKRLLLFMSLMYLGCGTLRDTSTTAVFIPALDTHFPSSTCTAVICVATGAGAAAACRRTASRGPPTAARAESEVHARAAMMPVVTGRSAQGSGVQCRGKRTRAEVVF